MSKPDGELLTESQLFDGYANAGIVLAPASEVVATLELIAREVATIRELVELLVAWAGIDPEAHRAPDTATRSWGDVLGESEP
jgi:hypothetical protein